MSPNIILFDWVTYEFIALIIIILIFVLSATSLGEISWSAIWVVLRAKGESLVLIQIIN